VVGTPAVVVDEYADLGSQTPRSFTKNQKVPEFVGKIGLCT